MARIEYKWDEPKLDMYQSVDPDNFFSVLPDGFKKADKPILVYLTSDLADDAQVMKNVESSVLKDENVSIGASSMFQQIKMNGLKIKDSHPMWKTLGGKSLPRMVVVDTSGAKIGAVEGRDISASKLFGMMKRAASKTYKTDIDTVVKETKAILTEIDKVEAKRTALATKKASSTVAKEADWAKEEKALNDETKAIETREAALKKKWADDRKVTKA